MTAIYFSLPLHSDQSIRVNVVPFSSPIATQLQLEKLHELDWSTKPASTVPGTLILDLPLAEPIQLSVSLTYQDVKRCLIGLQTKIGGQSNGVEPNAENSLSGESLGQRGTNGLGTLVDLNFFAW
ncbi:hypothetical protein FBUS_00533 [Fasciolopsis buskii]|uniref:Uncharacterized protein n=1 Tax=Fasciolopsis buskii TaxID=27845 RepID=A0A8E0VN99_9TREM|nr:hypothetical protein FBUS_00533 [Fasciolopsis buski]